MTFELKFKGAEKVHSEERISKAQGIANVKALNREFASTGTASRLLE
jgi:hypothetical protein